MAYMEKIEEDNLRQIMEQNISYLDQIAEQINLGYVSVFAGAGLSIASGYVDWKRLLSPICKQMRLNENTDLTEIAQYYKNQYGRQGLNDVVFNEFAKVPKNNQNAILLAKLPIKQFWTTNYDDVLEKEIEKQGKVVETIINQESFKYHDPRREVVIYKMHGDKRYPDDVVLTREDYQRYDESRQLFTRLLSVELVSRTFLFIGFSFNDPNLERILSIAKSSLNSKTLPKHYCFMRKVQISDYCDDKGVITGEMLEKFVQDKNYQELRIKDMANYGIYTILIGSFHQITLMLQYLYNKHTADNVFISGGIDPTELSNYGDFNKGEGEESDLSRAEQFLKLLGKELVDNNFRIYTGFGAGVGNYILSGVLASQKNRLYSSNVTDSKIHISSLIDVEGEAKEKIRKDLIGQCKSIIFLFGYVKDKATSGTWQEYKIALQSKNYVVPVKVTGFAAQEIYNDLDKQNRLPEELRFLESENGIGPLVKGIINVLREFRDKKERELKELLFSRAISGETGVFISYHYESDHDIAKAITEKVNDDEMNIFTVVKEEKKKKDEDAIKDWIDKVIKRTRITVLLISKSTLDRTYVSYELEKSLSNENAILPILIDSKENGFCEEDMESLRQRLEKMLPDKKLEMKKWFQEEGEKNILKWLVEIEKSIR